MAAGLDSPKTKPQEIYSVGSDLVFSQQWASDGSAFISMNKGAYRSADRGLTWRLVGEKSVSLGYWSSPVPFAVWVGPGSSPILYSAGVSSVVTSPWDSFWSMTLGGKSRARVSKPVVSAAITSRSGRFISFSGSARPGHAADTAVKIRLYKKSGGTYRRYRTYTAGLYSLVDLYGYQLKWSKLPAGSYYVTAEHSCARHTLGVSKRTYFTRARAFSSRTWR